MTTTTNGHRYAALHAYLDPSAHGAIADAADRIGISITALVQAVAENIDGVLGVDELGDTIRYRARRIDADRRRRR